MLSAITSLRKLINHPKLIWDALHGRWGGGWPPTGPTGVRRAMGGGSRERKGGCPCTRPAPAPSPQPPKTAHARPRCRRSVARGEEASKEAEGFENCLDLFPANAFGGRSARGGMAPGARGRQAARRVVGPRAGRQSQEQGMSWGSRQCAADVWRALRWCAFPPCPRWLLQSGSLLC